MVEYKCFRCGHTATQRCNFRNHLNRKNICIPILEDISINDIKNYYKIDLDIKPTNNPIEPKNNPSKPILTQNNEFCCHYCQKSFQLYHLTKIL